MKDQHKNKSNKKYHIIIVLTFLVLLFVLTIADIITQDKFKSENENRILQQNPEFTINRLFNGQYTKEYENYISDQFILRDNWISLKVKTDQIMLKKDINGVYIGKDNYLLEKHNKNDIETEQLQLNINRLTQMCDKYKDKNIRIMMVPSAAAILSEKLPDFAPFYDDNKITEMIKSQLNDKNIILDTASILQEHKDEYIYYKTDHHWTSLGAYYAYTQWAQSIGITPLNQSEFDIKILSDEFYGTIHSKLNINTHADTIKAYYPKNKIDYTIKYNLENKQYDTVYNMDALKTKDKYSVFLNGNNAIAQISTNIDNNRNLLIIRDSFANCFVPFALNHFENISVIDLRYYNAGIEQYINDNNITDILILYNTIKFAQDKNTSGLMK